MTDFDGFTIGPLPDGSHLKLRFEVFDQILRREGLVEHSGDSELFVQDLQVEFVCLGCAQKHWLVLVWTSFSHVCQDFDSRHPRHLLV